MLGAVAASTALCVPPVGAAVARPRTLRFTHLHTGEELEIAYASGGEYIPEALSTIGTFLRDFRTGETHPIDPALLDLLHDLQAAFDTQSRFQIVSGYRSPRTNAMLRAGSSGVAKRSLHMQGRAVDVRLTGVPTASLSDRARAMRRGGVGYYAKSDFVHLDTGRPRSW